MRTILCKRLKFTDGCFLALKNCSFLTLVANKIIASALIGARLTHRKFVRTDVTTQDSEETATAFTASQSSHNSRTKL